MAAITNEQVTAAVNDSFADVQEFEAMLKLLAGVGARVKLEVQRDATYRAIQAKQAELQATQSALQQQLVAASQQTEAETAALQQQAAQLQAQIDALNAQLPVLLQ